jgi:putative protease
MQEQGVLSQTLVGHVTHYWTHLGVAGIHLDAPLSVGDRIHVIGHTSDFEQRVDSIEVDHQRLSHADAGADVGIVVVEHAREHDAVYRLTEMAEVGEGQMSL